MRPDDWQAKTHNGGKATVSEQTRRMCAEHAENMRDLLDKVWEAIDNDGE